MMLLRRAADRLVELQYDRDGPWNLRGEFPMWVSGRVPRPDTNYLSGYALAHLALAARLTGLPVGVAEALERLIERAQFPPARYQTDAGLGNWYSGRGTGLPCPVAYPWPGGRVLCLHDDYDDTAISAILTTLSLFELARPITPATFAVAAHDPARDADRELRRRAQLAGGAAGVYQSWSLASRWLGTRDGGGRRRGARRDRGRSADRVAYARLGTAPFGSTAACGACRAAS